MSPMRYELVFLIPEDDIFHSYHREDSKSYRDVPWLSVTTPLYQNGLLPNDSYIVVRCWNSFGLLTATLYKVKWKILISTSCVFDISLCLCYSQKNSLVGWVHLTEMSKCHRLISCRVSAKLRADRREDLKVELPLSSENYGSDGAGIETLVSRGLTST
jgi:hypothetical protein